jgi:hypothetical protein
VSRPLPPLPECLRAAARHRAQVREAAAIAELPAPRQAVAVLTAEEAAARLGVTVRQLNRYQAAGLITPIQNVPRGRRQFTEESVDQLRQRLT